MTSQTTRRLLLTVRILVGLVFLVSSIGKFINSSDARYLVELLATRFYWLVEYTYNIVTGVSIVEFILAVLLFWGKKLQWVLATCMILILVFTVLLGYFYVQGIAVEHCGCFGTFDLGGGLFVSLLKNIFLLAILASGIYLDRQRSIAKTS